MDTHHKYGLWDLWEREFRMFFNRENHTVGNYLFLYWAIAIGILFLLIMNEVL